MRQLADFVNRMMVEPQTRAGVARRGRRGAHPARTGRAIGVIGIPGDRRDEDQREYGALAGGAFDEIIIREDANLRGRAARRDGGQRRRRASRPRADEGRGRTIKVEKVLDEPAAVRAALRRAAPGDLVVVCADDAVGVYREAMALAGRDAGRARRSRTRASSRRPEG